MHNSTRITAATWIVWVTAVIAYVLAIVNRSSFATLGSTAQIHFGIEATMLSMLLVMQVAVYTASQIPVGVLLDRFGATRVMVAGLFVMATGQLLMAFAPSAGFAIFARVLVGMGDSGLFIGALRLVADWFPQRFVPVVSQFTGMLGALGQIIAVVPLAAIVENYGWAPGFATLAGATFSGFILSACLVRDSAIDKTLLATLLTKKQRGADHAPAAANTQTTEQPWDSPLGLISPPTTAIPIMGAGGSGIFKALKELVKRPGVRLAYWVHFGTAGALHCYILLWGNAFLTGGEGQDKTTAAGLLTLTIVASIVAGMLMGPLQSRFKRHRINYVLTYLAVLMLLWVLVLFWPGGAAPLPLLIMMSIVLAIGGPSCMIAFDVVRTHVHRNQIGMASGIINTGSFTAALLLIFGIGLLLDLQGAGSPESYSIDAFRVAMSLQFVFWVLAIVGILIELPKAKRALERRQARLQLRDPLP